MKLRLSISAFAALGILLGCKGSGHSAQSATSESAQTHRPAHPQNSEPAGFDFYLLNLSWSPEFCHSHSDAQECAAHPTFVLHGLWPQNNDGTYPEHCSNSPGPSDPGAYSDIYPDAGLLEHEWATHGTCSGLSPDAFFSNARSAFHAVKVPPKLSNLSAQISMPPDEILDLFTASNPGISESSMALSCGHNYLTAVEICLDKGLHPITCPNVRSCRANVVRIPPP